MNDQNRSIFAASFPSADGGSRAGGAIAGAFPDKVGNVAVLHVASDGTPKFVESKDWGAGRGALVGGAIGILAGPLGIIAGGGIGALAAKLRDSGFKDDQLEQLGRTLSPGHSAVIVEIAADAVDTAKALSAALGSTDSTVVALETSVADLFSGDAAPTPEPTAATPGT